MSVFLCVGVCLCVFEIVRVTHVISSEQALQLGLDRRRKLERRRKKFYDGHLEEWCIKAASITVIGWTGNVRWRSEYYTRNLWLENLNGKAILGDQDVDN